MKKMILTSIFLVAGAMEAFGSTDPDFVLADVEPLPPAEYTVLGENGPVSTVAKLQVTYWIQPCADQRFDQFVVTNSVDAERRPQMRVGVLIYDSGLICRGPLEKETKTLTFNGAFNLPGEIPEIERLKSLNGNL